LGYCSAHSKAFAAFIVPRTSHARVEHTMDFRSLKVTFGS
jgi:hypothetical protein